MKEDPWHDKEEAYLKKIEAQCNAYHVYFNKDYMYYHSLSSRFNIPILVVSSINALTAISLNDFLVQRYVSILNAVLSAGVGILGSIQLYMKINEKMANALRSGILMKRLALKISKEMSIDREQRGTIGQQPPVAKPMSIMNLASAAVASLTPKRSSMDLEASFTSYGKMSPPEGTRAKMLWGFLGTNRRAESSPPESESPPNLNESIPEEDSPRGRDAGL